MEDKQPDEDWDGFRDRQELTEWIGKGEQRIEGRLERDEFCYGRLGRKKRGGEWRFTEFSCGDSLVSGVHMYKTKHLGWQEFFYPMSKLQAWDRKLVYYIKKKYCMM